jgi:hypothetical protein
MEISQSKGVAGWQWSKTLNGGAGMAWPKRHFPEIKNVVTGNIGPGMIILPVTPLIVWNYIPPPEKQKAFQDHYHVGRWAKRL